MNQMPVVSTGIYIIINKLRDLMNVNVTERVY